MEKSDRVLRKPEVLNLTGVSACSLWRWEKVGSFPKRIALGPNSCGWLESEVQQWISDKASKRASIVSSASDWE
ncbi:MAG: AlpA family phage regulatory protein [Proteobacteria bacterium]|nr:AlpA family phage regulatory protein [Desulfobacula sp.]MBU3951651.1 AlpA family phage regulatory protein [Pseudomonadota bacterium]MBU4131528.1 AlpA family phage regulatory protein [Pseudomonadota bacterium]